MGLLIGSTAPLSYIAWGRTYQGGSPGDLESDWALSPPVTGHPVTGHPFIQSPVSQSPVNQSLVSQSPVIQSPVSQSQSASHGQPVTGQPVTGQLVTSQPGTGQLGTSHQSFTYDFQSPLTNQFISGYSQVNVPQQTNAPSVSSHVSQGSTCRLPNIHHSGYEHSEVKRVPKSSHFFQTIYPP